MKIKFLDILSILVLIALFCMGIGFTLVYLNPQLAFNPFPPPTLPAALVIPSATNTPRILPPTWTPTPQDQNGQQPSSTPLPSPTSFELPTFTPTLSPTVTPTQTPFFTGTPTAGPYRCSSSIKPPLDGSVLQPKSGFDGRWILKNTGEKYWDSELTEAVYLSGTKFQREDDPGKFKRDVQPGSSAEIIIDMEAPDGIGTHYATWGLVYKDITICTWTITLRVSK